jgi:hypothetical protein
LGIPSLYLYLLYSAKDEIINRATESKEKDDDGKKLEKESNGKGDEESAMESSKEGSADTNAVEPTEMSPATERLQFLWGAYQPRLWYWEVIETTRKLMLTAVLSVCAPGSPKQTVFGILMSFGYIRLYSFYRPYQEDSECVWQKQVNCRFCLLSL